MSEQDLIHQSFRGPVTIKMLVEDLEKLGVKKGMTLIVHSSLSSLGWVCGGAQAVVMALEKALTPEGTLIMPTYTGWNSDPKGWRSPPVPSEWVEIIREELPAFDPHLSPTKSMGIIVDTFRAQREILRSSHPRASFAAWGFKADFVTSNHSLNFPFGENSPLARAYELNASILLIGAPYDTVNSWYLSAYRSKWSQTHIEECSAVIEENSKRVWKKYEDHQRKHDDFEEIGRNFEAVKNVKKGLIGHAESRLMSQVDAVDFGMEWMNTHRE